MTKWWSNFLGSFLVAVSPSLKLATVLPSPGSPEASNRAPTLAGLNAFISDLNSRGGVHGKKIELVPIQMHSMVDFDSGRFERGEILGFAYVHDEFTHAGASPLIGSCANWSSQFNGVRGCLRTLFVDRAAEIERALRFAAEAFRGPSLVVVETRLDRNSKGSSNEILGDVRIDRMASAHLDVKALANGHPSAIVVIGESSSVVDVIINLRQQGIDTPVVVDSVNLPNTKLLTSRGLGPNVYCVSRVPYWMDDTEVIARDFRHRMKSIGQAEFIGAPAFWGYLSAAFATRVLSRPKAAENAESFKRAMDIFGGGWMSGLRLGYRRNLIEDTYVYRLANARWERVQLPLPLRGIAIPSEPYVPVREAMEANSRERAEDVEQPNLRFREGKRLIGKFAIDQFSRVTVRTTPNKRPIQIDWLGGYIVGEPTHLQANQKLWVDQIHQILSGADVCVWDDSPEHSACRATLRLGYAGFQDQDTGLRFYMGGDVPWLGCHAITALCDGEREAKLRGLFPAHFWDSP